MGRVAPGVPLSRVKERLAQVKGSVVEAPIISADQDGETGVDHRF